MPFSGDCSPAKDSPSRRKRLLGTLRSMGSLRSLRAAHAHSTAPNDSNEQPKSEPESPPTPGTPTHVTPSLSLDFEASPPHRPMFTMGNMSSSSSVVVRHSSPITVPQPVRQSPPLSNTPPDTCTFVVGTVPDSPAPLQTAAVQEAILSHATNIVLNADSPKVANRIAGPLPTPMPFAHLPLQDADTPGILIVSPSASTMAPTVRPSSLRRHSEEDPEYFLANSSKERVTTREHSLVTTDELDADTDAEIVAMLGMAPMHHTASEASSAQLDPVHSDEAMPLSDDDTLALDFPKSDGSNNALFNCEAIGGSLACIVWDSPTTFRAWSSRYTSPRHQQTSHPSSSDNTEAETEATDVSIPEEARACGKTGRGTGKQRKDAHVSADDRETLQEIIRSYAGSMMYHEEAEAHHACEHSDDFSEFQTVPLDEVTRDEVKAEVEDSIRVMNRSLGG
jgi:hypothetical protein